MRDVPITGTSGILSEIDMLGKYSIAKSILLYDLTSTYFEGLCLSNPKAKRGYSRDSRPDCKQVGYRADARRGRFPQSARNLWR